MKIKDVRAKHLFMGVVAIVSVLLLWRSVIVQYHRLAMRTWHRGSNWEAWSKHQESLIGLGYFGRRDFPLKQRVLTNNSDFMRFVDTEHFRDGQWAVTPHSNRVTVIGYNGDMGLWSEIVARFDQAKPGSAANMSQPIGRETNRTLSEAGSGR